MNKVQDARFVRSDGLERSLDRITARPTSPRRVCFARDEVRFESEVDLTQRCFEYEGLAAANKVNRIASQGVTRAR